MNLPVSTIMREEKRPRKPAQSPFSTRRVPKAHDLRLSRILGSSAVISQVLLGSFNPTSVPKAKPRCMPRKKHLVCL